MNRVFSRCSAKAPSGDPLTLCKLSACARKHAEMGPIIVGTSLPGLNAMDGYSDFASSERTARLQFIRSSAFTVTGIAQDSHPHFPKCIPLEGTRAAPGATINANIIVRRMVPRFARGTAPHALKDRFRSLSPDRNAVGPAKTEAGSNPMSAKALRATFFYRIRYRS